MWSVTALQASGNTEESEYVYGALDADMMEQQVQQQEGVLAIGLLVQNFDRNDEI